MTARSWFLVPGFVVSVLVAATLREGVTPIVSAATGGPSVAESTLDDQVDLNVTVYNADLALVRDVRNIRLPKETSDLRFQDIAATVNPATVHFRSLSDPGRVAVLEQNYEYDLLEPEKLLRKYVGRDVTLVRRRTENGTTHEEAVTARLLSYNGAPVWRIGNEIVTGITADHIRYPELPGNLFVRPTLIWTLQNSGRLAHRVEASYLATKLAWKADYVLTVARDETIADLDGWVTLTNGSGTSFRNASLQLVAGELNRVREALGDARLMHLAERLPAAAAPPMAEESLSDYHLYTLARRTTINHSETKQVSLLGATGVPVRKRYVVDGRTVFYRNAQHPGSPVIDDVQVFFELKNEEQRRLGMPMPSGTMRVYQADAKGALQFVGEDRIRHTPKDETINVKIGHAFDLVAERKQLDFRRVADDVVEIEVAVTLRNHKPQSVTIEVNEPIGGTWRMVRSSHRWTKTDAWAAQFVVPVSAGGDVTLSYRARVTY